MWNSSSTFECRHVGHRIQLHISNDQCEYLTASILCRFDKGLISIKEWKLARIVLACWDWHRMGIRESMIYSFSNTYNSFVKFEYFPFLKSQSWQNKTFIDEMKLANNFRTLITTFWRSIILLKQMIFRIQLKDKVSEGKLNKYVEKLGRKGYFKTFLCVYSRSWKLSSEMYIP